MLLKRIKTNIKIALACLLLTLVACEQPNQDSAQQSASIIVTDYNGSEVKLGSPATSVVALAPHIVENIFSAGAGGALIGTVSYSNYPEQAKTVELVGSFNKVNYERILELNPDLIIAWHSGNNANSINRLKEMGFEVYVDKPSKLEDVAKSIKDIGTLTGNQASAEAVAKDYLDNLNNLRQRYNKANTVKAFYQVWNRPLQTINGDHMISKVIELCGGKNIYADETSIAPIINIESILQRNPDAILASGINDKRPIWLDEWSSWQSINAVKNEHLFFVPADHIQRHTVRLLSGATRICEQLDQVRQTASN